METHPFRKICSEEFKVNRFSVISEFDLMSETFNIKPRTLKEWTVKGTRPYFDKMYQLYVENRRMSENLRLIYQKLTSS